MKSDIERMQEALSRGDTDAAVRWLVDWAAKVEDRLEEIELGMDDGLIAAVSASETPAGVNVQARVEPGYRIERLGNNTLLIYRVGLQTTEPESQKEKR